MIIATESHSRWRIDPGALIRARSRAGLSLAQLGEACGWSKQYQWKLEAGHVRTVHRGAARALCAALTDAGVDARLEVKH